MVPFYIIVYNIDYTIDLEPIMQIPDPLVVIPRFLRFASKGIAVGIGLLAALVVVLTLGLAAYVGITGHLPPVTSATKVVIAVPAVVLFAIAAEIFDRWTGKGAGRAR